MGTLSAKRYNMLYTEKKIWSLQSLSFPHLPEQEAKVLLGSLAYLADHFLLNITHFPSREQLCCQPLQAVMTLLGEEAKDSP